MELNIKHIQGKSKSYSEVYSPLGYCFYDVDKKDRSYTDHITTPILDEQELKRKFVLVEGDADKLNEELQKQEVLSEQ